MLRAAGAPDSDRDDWLDEFFDSEIEWHDVPVFPSGGVHSGRDALRRHAAEFEDAWADWGVEIEDIEQRGIASLPAFVSRRRKAERRAGNRQREEPGDRCRIRPSSRSHPSSATVRHPRRGSRSRGAVGISDVEENVEIVRRAIDAFNRRDLDAATWDNDLEVEVDSDRSRGRGGRRLSRTGGGPAFRNAFLGDVRPDHRLRGRAHRIGGEHVAVPNRGTRLGPGRSRGRSAKRSRCDSSQTDASLDRASLRKR